MGVKFSELTELPSTPNSTTIMAVSDGAPDAEVSYKYRLLDYQEQVQNHVLSGLIHSGSFVINAITGWTGSLTLEWYRVGDLQTLKWTSDAGGVISGGTNFISFNAAQFPVNLRPANIFSTFFSTAIGTTFTTGVFRIDANGNMTMWANANYGLYPNGNNFTLKASTFTYKAAPF